MGRAVSASTLELFVIGALWALIGWFFADAIRATWTWNRTHGEGDFRWAVLCWLRVLAIALAEASLVLVGTGIRGVL